MHSSDRTLPHLIAVALNKTIPKPYPYYNLTSENAQYQDVLLAKALVDLGERYHAALDEVRRTLKKYRAAQELSYGVDFYRSRAQEAIDIYHEIIDSGASEPYNLPIDTITHRTYSREVPR